MSENHHHDTGYKLLFSHAELVQQLLEGFAPPVFPIVLYNGEKRWQVATNIADLIQCPAVLSPYQPNMAYYLLDEGAYTESELNSVHNAVAAVFSLENANTHEAATQAIEQMAQAIKQLPNKQRIDKAISYWIKRHLQRNLPQVIIPQTEQLLEDTSMLATNIQKWYHHAHESGVMQGELQGFAKILEVQLRAKFHDVNDADFMPKLHTADQKDLMRYSVQLLTATSLEQVFS